MPLRPRAPGTPSHRLLFIRITVAALLCALAGPAATQSAGGGAPAVTVAKPLARKVTEWDEYTGRFVAKRRVEVRARVSGYLDSVHFTEGQHVEAGQLLFVIDPRPFRAEAARARAEVERARTTLSVATLEYERGERLAAERAMSRENLEERRAARDAAQATMDAAKAEQRIAELNLGFTEVRAPMAGRASDIRIDEGNLISGGDAGSTVLTTIVSLDPIEIEFEGSESEFLRYTRLDTAGTRRSSRVEPNPVEARLIDETDWQHKGVMTFVDNELDPHTATMRGRATFSNPDHVLLPGMFARLRLYGAPEHDALLIPDSAIVTDQALKLVMIVGDDNIVRAQPVEPGSLIDGLRVIRSGLTAADRVVIKGLLRARPGQAVTPEEQELTTPDNG